MWAYEQTVQPPAPLVDVIIRHPEDSTQVAHVRAKIDTAADISAIPVTLVDQLELPIIKKLIVKGYDDIPTTLFTYNILLEVAQVRFNSIRVIAIPRMYVLLGRDVLNYFYIRLNGPDLTFDLSLTPL